MNRPEPPVWSYAAAPAPALYQTGGSGWALVAVLPALCHASLASTLAWATALVIGAHLTGGHLMPNRWFRLRWVAIAWVASTAVPGTPVLATVASGTSAASWLSHLRMALVGLAMAILWPVELRNAGTFLLIAGLILALQRSEA